MTVSIIYRYSADLVDQIYVESGKHEASDRFDFGDAELTPATRAAALLARCYHYMLLVSPDNLPSHATQPECMRVADCTTRVACCDVATSVAPTRAVAVAAVEAQMIAAAAFAPALADLMVLRAAAREQQRANDEACRAQQAAAEVEANILIVCQWPLSRWIDVRRLRETVSAPARLPDDVAKLEACDPRIAARIDLARARARELRGQASRMVEGYGTASEVERYAAGVLPEDEYDALASDALFATFGDLRLYTPLVDGDLEHHEGCPGGCNFRTADYAGGLTEEQYESRKIVRALVDAIGNADALDVAGDVAIATVTREHEAYCSSDLQACTASATRLSERVTIEFAGTRYRWEFAL